VPQLCHGFAFAFPPFSFLSRVKRLARSHHHTHTLPFPSLPSRDKTSNSQVDQVSTLQDKGTVIVLHLSESIQIPTVYINTLPSQISYP